MVIDELARQNARLFPGYELVSWFEAGFPVFRAALNLLMLQPQPLSALEEFLVRSVKAGLANPTDIANFLGLDEDIVRAGLVELLQSDVLKISVKADGSEVLALSSKGEAILRDPELSRRETVGLTVQVDGLTGELQPHESGLLQAKHLRKGGLSGIHKAIDTPTETYFDYNKVKQLLTNMAEHGRSDLPEGDLLDVAGVEKIWCEYRRMQVLVYCATGSDDFSVAVFLGHRRQPEYESVLLRLEKKGIKVILTESRDEGPSQSGSFVDSLRRILPEGIDDVEAATTADRYEELSRKLGEISEGVTKAQERLSYTQSEEERIRLEATIAQLNAQRDALEKTLQEYKAGLRLLKTYDHRPLLEEALTKASNRVIVISPWVKSDAVDDVMIDLIDKALQRQVDVTLGYGISPASKEHHAYALRRLRELQQKKHGKRLRLVDLGNTHEKVLVCDERFAVVSSFNFLSFRGAPDRGFREERGIYIGIRDFVDLVAEDAMHRLSAS